MIRTWNLNQIKYLNILYINQQSTKLIVEIIYYVFFSYLEINKKISQITSIIVLETDL